MEIKMNLFTRTAPWVAATLLAAVSTFAQNSKCAPSAQKSCQPGKFYEQGHELVCTQMMAGYNAPARIDVRCSWDVYATGSFLYWQPTEENLELGISNSTPYADIEDDGIAGNVIDMNFKFKPGFKVALGMNFDHDNWDAFAEYTWLHGTSSTYSNGPSALGGGILPFWGTPHLIDGNEYNTASGNWNVKLDFLDVAMARSYYVGTSLSFRPMVGARAAWIRQTYLANYLNNGDNAINVGDGGASFVSDTSVKNRSRSWGLGPRMGLGTNWMVGQGLRIYGDAAADVLYTRYTLQFKQTDSDLSTLHETVRQKHIDYLRTHLDLEIGIGWGMYLDNNNWHIDLAAGYGFQVFFDQNMFRHYSDSSNYANSFAPNGNLFVNGLTATARLDF